MPLTVINSATIGGTVAAGLSGPGRFRYGGVRDFLIGASFLSGDGHEIHSGGKVVKNAAGFDIPKLMVGSLGRLGILTRLTFKVFPKPIATQTLTLIASDTPDAIQKMAFAASQRWELDAIDYRPATQTIFFRLAGPPEVNEAIANDIASKFGGETKPLSDADTFWNRITDLDFGPIVAKVPITASTLPLLSDFYDAMHVSAAVNVAWIGLSSEDEVKRLDAALQKLSMAGLVVTGSIGRSPMIGSIPKTKTMDRLQAAMDPAGKFVLIK